MEIYKSNKFPTYMIEQDSFLVPTPYFSSTNNKSKLLIFLCQQFSGYYIIF